MNKLQNRTTDIDKDSLKQLDDFIDALDTNENILIDVLHKAQSIFGYLSKEIQLYIARKLDIAGAEVFGVVSFYSFFTMQPPGIYSVNVCMGTACFVRGADKVLDAFKSQLEIDVGKTTSDNLFTLKDVRCVGACGLAPVVSINDKIYGHVTEEDVPGMIDKCRKEAGNGN